MKKHFYISVMLSWLFCTPIFPQANLLISGGNNVASYLCGNSIVVVWGQNDGGRLGIGTSGGTVNSPTEIPPNRFPDALGNPLLIKQVNSGSGGHFVALSCTGPTAPKTQVWSWGGNDRGQIGNGVRGGVVAAPVRVRAGAVIDAAFKETVGGISYLVDAAIVYAGNATSYAILSNGELVSWGGNGAGPNIYTHTYGQLGDGTQIDRYEAVYVLTGAGQRLRNVVSVCAGDNAAYALDANGQVWSWGWEQGNNGQLGQAANINQTNYAQRVNYAAGRPMNNIKYISCSDGAGFAIDNDDYVWAWGNGGWNSQLGVPNNASGWQPRQTVGVGGTGFLQAKQVAGGQGFGMAVTLDGRAVVWGGGGCLDGGGGNSIAGGNSTGVPQYITSPANTANNVALINRADHGGWFVTMNGDVYAFGCNRNADAGITGILGTGNTADVPTPTRITLPSNCYERDLSPEVNLTPKSMTVCKSKFTNQVLNSGFTVTRNLQNYTIKWYKDNNTTPVLTGQGTAASVTAAKTYTATGEGRYRVVIEYTGHYGGCGGLPEAEEEMTISFYPQQFEAPTDITFCGDEAEVYVKPKAPATATTIANRVYEWYPTATAPKAQALGTSTGTGKTTINVGGANIPIAGDGSKTVYVEEIAASAGAFMRRTVQTCQTTSGELNLTAGAINPANNQAYAGFTVYETVTLTEASILLMTSQQPGQSGRATVTLGIYRAGANNGGPVPIGTPIGTLVANYDRTRTGAELQDVTALVLATGSVLLQPGEYFIGPSAYAVTGQISNPKLLGTSCAGVKNGVDNVNGNILRQNLGMAAYNNPNQAAQNPMAFDIKFQTTQQFCDRIPVKLEKCPCDAPDKLAMKIKPNPATMCPEGTITLTSEKPVIPQVASSNFVFSWYRGTSTTGAPIAGPTTTKVDHLDLKLDWAAAGSQVYTLRVVNTTQANCEDTVQITVVSHPLPKLSSTLTPPAICSGATFNYTATSATVATPAPTFSWTRAPVVGITEVAGSGTTGVISEKLTNTTAAPITVTYKVTTKANGCENTEDVTVVVKPEPTVTQPTNQSLCAGKSTEIVTFAGNIASGVTYNWTNDKPEIGLAATGAGNIAVFTAKNTTTTAIVATIKVTPTADGCTGEAKEFSITVEPEPVITLTSAAGTDAQNLCQDETIKNITYSLTGGATGVQIIWQKDGAPSSAPGGIAINPTVGMLTISGTPNQWGAFAYEIITTGQHASCDAATVKGTITVNEIPEPPFVTEVNLLKGTGSQSIASGATSSGTNTLNWYSTETSNDGKTTAPMQDTSVEDVFYYWVSQKSTAGCESKRVKVTVNVNDAPKPKVTPAFYCKGTTPASLTTLATADPGHKLVWYANESDNKDNWTATPTKTIDTSTPGEFKFYVAQQNDDTKAISEKSTIVVTVYDVMPPKVTNTAPEYCIERDGFTPNVVALAADPQTQGDFFKSSGLEWYKGAVNAGNKLGGAPTPEVNVEGDTEYNVRQYYTIASSGEVCYGEPVTITVTINKTQTPSSQTNFEVRYKRKDLLANPNTNLLAQDADGKVAVTNCSGCTLQWSTDGTNFGNAVPTPKPSVGFDGKNESQDQFWVRQYDGKCYSEPVQIIVYINDAPSPKVSPVSYCEGGNGQIEVIKRGTTVGANVVVANTDFGGVDADFSLQWYRNADKTGAIGGANADLDISNDIKALVWSGQASQELNYYATQTNTNVSPPVESEPEKLTITVYANPKLRIDQAAVEIPCEKTVNINQRDKVWFLDNTVMFDVTPNFYNNATDDVTQPGNATYTPTAIGQSGTYFMGLQFKNTNRPANTANEFCFSQIVNDKTPKAINVKIDSLKINELIAPASTCPGTAVPVEAKVYANNGNTISYAWTGTKTGGSFEGFNGANNLAIVNTNNLTTVEGTQYTFTVTVEAGACKGTSSKSETSGKLTIGSGPVIGTMIVKDGAAIHTTPTNEITFTGDNNKNPFEFWSCGGNITINTNYMPSDPLFPLKDFVWYEGSTQVGTGPNLSITDWNATSAQDRTFRLEYVNKCAAYVLVTVKSRPLSVTNNLTAVDMGFCQGNKFEAKLNIAGKENGITTILWKKDGVTQSETSDTYTIPNAMPTDDGVYSYIVTTRGCVIDQAIAGGTPLKVDPKPQFGTPTIVPFCEGETKDISVALITPAGTILTWYDANNVVVGSGETISVTPPFTSANANAERRSTYTYNIKAEYGFCTTPTTVPVYVDEPLSATLPVDPSICEGFSATIDASAYQATSYIWTANEKPVGSGAKVSVTPKVTTTYQVDMMRGECEATDYVTVTVNSNPVIARIDTTLGVRIREIVVKDGTGTPPFLYSVDSEKPDAFDTNPVKKDLTFGWHTFYVLDINGCRSKGQSHEMLPPPIFIPNFFSPQGDGINDTWKVGNLQEVYPDAIVTIYDRFGKQLIQYKGESEGWDGKYLGKDMPTTDYWYVIEIKEIGKQYVGHFTLLRR